MTCFMETLLLSVVAGVFVYVLWLGGFAYLIFLDNCKRLCDESVFFSGRALFWVKNEC